MCVFSKLTRVFERTQTQTHRSICTTWKSLQWIGTFRKSVAIFPELHREAAACFVRVCVQSSYRLRWWQLPSKRLRPSSSSPALWRGVKCCSLAVHHGRGRADVAPANRKSRTSFLIPTELVTSWPIFFCLFVSFFFVDNLSGTTRPAS